MDLYNVRARALCFVKLWARIQKVNVHIERILDACRACDTDTVCRLLDEHNLHSDVHDDDDVTPLQIAAATGNNALVGV
jgi:ankyrin repeat protein